MHLVYKLVWKFRIDTKDSVYIRNVFIRNIGECNLFKVIIFLPRFGIFYVFSNPFFIC